MPLCSYEKAGRLAKFSVAQSEISAKAGDGWTAFSLTQHNFCNEKKMVYGGGCPPSPPHKVFLSFFLEDKKSVPNVFSSRSFIPGTHFETSLVMLSCYGYEI